MDRIGAPGLANQVNLEVQPLSPAKLRIFTAWSCFHMEATELWVRRCTYRVVRVQGVTWHAGTVDSDNFPWRYPRLSTGYQGPIFVFSEISAPKSSLTSTSLPWRTVPGTAI